MTVPWELSGPVVAPIAALIVLLQSAAIAWLLVERSRRARAERDLRENEARFRLLADRAPVLLWTTQPDTTLDYLNNTCCEFTGLPLERLLDHGWLDSVHPDDLDRCRRIYLPAMEGRTPFLMEYRIRRADGEYRWVLDSGIPKFGRDGGFAGYVGASIDITDRRRAEEANRETEAELKANYLEIQRLAGSLITAQDAERARIARDLHDDVSQQLAALSISLSTAKRRAGSGSGDGELHQSLSSIQERAVALAESVRNLSHDLHPEVLRHAGLTATLEARCADVSRDRAIAVRWAAEGDFDSIDPETAYCVYRIAQEALHNVVKHSSARTAQVGLRHLGDSVELTVADNGKGFDIAATRKDGKGLGLLSISERVRLAGGTLSVVTERDLGTQVRVRLPLRKRDAPDTERPSERHATT